MANHFIFIKKQAVNVPPASTVLYTTCPPEGMTSPAPVPNTPVTQVVQPVYPLSTPIVVVGTGSATGTRVTFTGAAVVNRVSMGAMGAVAAGGAAVAAFAF